MRPPWLILYIAVRAGGFYVVTIANLRQGLLVLYGKSIFASLTVLPSIILTICRTVLMMVSLNITGTIQPTLTVYPVCLRIPRAGDNPVSPSISQTLHQKPPI